MPVAINGEKYYRTAEVCRMVGISRTTLFRWLNEGICQEPKHRDRRGWRLFAEVEVDGLNREINRINKTEE